MATTPSLRPARRSAKPRVIAMLAVENAQILDVVGPLEVFGSANRWLIAQGLAAAPAYRLQILAQRAGPVTMNSGLRLVATQTKLGSYWGSPTMVLYQAPTGTGSSPASP